MSNDTANTTQTIFKTIFKGLLLKLHIDEVIEACLDVVVRFHRGIGKALESACHAIPPLMLLFEGIGHIAAITKRNHAKTRFEKAALGVKVMTGIVGLGTAITAFALPHVSVPVIMAGTAANVAHSYFDLYKTAIAKKTLEKTLEKLPPQHHEQRLHLLHDIDELNSHAVAHREKLKEGMIKTALSTLILVGFIAMAAAPVIALPTSIVLAVATASYTVYHYKKPILAGIRQLFTSRKVAEPVATPDAPSNQEDDKDTTKPSPCADSQNVADFLHHEDKTLASIATQHSNPTISVTETDAPKTPSIQIDETDDEEDDGGDGDTGETLEESESTMTEQLRP